MKWNCNKKETELSIAFISFCSLTQMKGDWRPHVPATTPLRSVRHLPSFGCFSPAFDHSNGKGPTHRCISASAHRILHLNITCLAWPWPPPMSLSRFTFQGWRDSSAVKSTGCSSSGPKFNSQQRHGGSQPSIMRSGLSLVYRRICRQNTAYIINIFLKKDLLFCEWPASK